ncbi:hypothetical protein RhiirC2_776325 [Rhizophagus irregularis]|uniref:DUF659 domain-containing protein n=1 Tax=Rhizophagus irregularis TaxID=588596 RepID=A0A2N1NH34_9GLOM|nr:hypothetical protein RhiirC2_776325 [Rhizophagus irregularis]
MTSSEPSENPRKGRCFTEDRKPHILREHLANHCRKCLQEVSLQFAKIVAMDGWTDPHGNSLWAFMLMTGSRKEYLLSLEDLSNIRHTGKHLSNVIEKVINKVGAKKFVAIVSDNSSNVAAARKIIANNYPNSKYH